MREHSREMLKAYLSGYCLKSLLMRVLLPEPEGPATTSTSFSTWSASILALTEATLDDMSAINRIRITGMIANTLQVLYKSPNAELASTMASTQVHM